PGITWISVVREAISPRRYGGVTGIGSGTGRATRAGASAAQPRRTGPTAAPNALAGLLKHRSIRPLLASRTVLRPRPSPQFYGNRVDQGAVCRETPVDRGPFRCLDRHQRCPDGREEVP